MAQPALSRNRVSQLDDEVKITVSLDSELVREIRALAAAEKKSISFLLISHLRQIVDERKGYDRARQRAVTRLRDGLDLKWTPPASRGELQER